jgi:hypothetical protein
VTYGLFVVERGYSDYKIRAFYLLQPFFCVKAQSWLKRAIIFF